MAGGARTRAGARCGGAGGGRRTCEGRVGETAINTENLLTGPTVTIQDAALTTKPLQPLSDATAILNKVIEQIESEDGWVPLGTVGKQLANIASDFDPRTFGFRKLSDLVRKTNSFDIDHPEEGTLRIRAKPPVPRRGRTQSK